jgi:uncharacterized protein YneF (UPF0154 family)
MEQYKIIILALVACFLLFLFIYAWIKDKEVCRQILDLNNDGVIDNFEIAYFKKHGKKLPKSRVRELAKDSIVGMGRGTLFGVLTAGISHFALTALVFGLASPCINPLSDYFFNVDIL